MLFPEWLNTDILKIIGWSVFHSIWQSMVLLILLQLSLWLIPKRRSGLRYLISISMLVATVTCAALTFQYESRSLHGEGGQAVAEMAVPVNATVNPAPALTPAPVTSNTSGTGLNLLQALTAVSPYCALLWMLGMLLYLIRMGYNWRYLHGLRKLPSETFPLAVDKLQELSQKMGIYHPLKLIITDKINEPLTFGHIKPVIMLPFSYVAQVPVDQLEMILAHELAHIRRKDYLINMLQAALDAIYFFNPFFHVMSRIVRNEREYCCDDMAAACCGNKETMAIALTNLKILSAHARLSLSAAPEKGTFYKRIYRLVNPRQRFRISMPLSTLILLSSFLIFLTKCVSELNNDLLPQPKDSVEQIYADNQANHKIEVFNYKKANRKHELFLVSTTNGDPLYAYIDGDTVSKMELDTIYKTIRQSRTISMEELSKIPPTPRQIRSRRTDQLNDEVDSIAALIRTLETASSNRKDEAAVKKQLDDMRKALSARTDEIKALAMEDYKEDVKNIPVDVQMHELLTRIITTRKYSEEDRVKLNQLLNMRK
ncbi:M56 family metallopeptidase [Longitalea luteola]|uniref:M56 family metallopeptidase n=1 Tax=Longitalea luteola TaxID=2812563 RepID=UPI001A95CD42|nr:M56 family metallopeptidase [Longitalea luteola]